MDQVCPPDAVDINTDNTQIELRDICQDDISCTTFQFIDDPFVFRTEQCYEKLYILVIYPVLEGEDKVMTLSAEYEDTLPCFTIYKGIHEEISTEAQCGQKSVETCEDTIKCSLTTCEYQNEAKDTEGI